MFLGALWLRYAMRYARARVIPGGGRPTARCRVSCALLSGKWFHYAERSRLACVGRKRPGAVNTSPRAAQKGDSTLPPKAAILNIVDTPSGGIYIDERNLPRCFAAALLHHASLLLLLFSHSLSLSLSSSTLFDNLQVCLACSFFPGFRRRGNEFFGSRARQLSWLPVAFDAWKNSLGDFDPVAKETGTDGVSVTVRVLDCCETTGGNRRLSEGAGGALMSRAYPK